MLLPCLLSFNFASLSCNLLLKLIVYSFGLLSNIPAWPWGTNLLKRICSLSICLRSLALSNMFSYVSSRHGISNQAKIVLRISIILLWTSSCNFLSIVISYIGPCSDICCMSWSNDNGRFELYMDFCNSASSRLINLLIRRLSSTEIRFLATYSKKC